MNNRLYIWGDKTSKDRDYSSFISFTIDEIMLNVRFEDFYKFLSLRDYNLQYQELLSSDDAFALIIDVLRAFQRDSERTYFTADVISKTYVKLMTFFESVVFKNTAFPKDKKLKVLDIVHDRLDKSVLDSVLDDKALAFQVVCDETIEVISVVAPDYVEEIRKGIELTDKSKAIPEMMSSDMFYEMTNLMAWIVNHEKYIRKENSYRLVMCSDIEVVMKVVLDALNRNKRIDFGGSIILEKISGSSISKSVSTFFEMISELLQSVLNRDKARVNYLDSHLIEKENQLFCEVWKTFQKEGSMWMISSKTSKKIMEYINK